MHEGENINITTRQHKMKKKRHITSIIIKRKIKFCIGFFNLFIDIIIIIMVSVGQMHSRACPHKNIKTYSTVPLTER